MHIDIKLLNTIILGQKRQKKRRRKFKMRDMVLRELEAIGNSEGRGKLVPN